VIDLPWPPSVNHYYSVAGGRKILSETGRAFKLYATQLMLIQHIDKIKAPSYSVHILARPPDRRRRDLDNVLKPLLDALTEYGAISDDSKIDDLRIQRLNPVKGGSIQISVTGIEK
jgi:crossover junction endodeoxyribonuclease RusA